MHRFKVEDKIVTEHYRKDMGITIGTIVAIDSPETGTGLTTKYKIAIKRNNTSNHIMLINRYYSEILPYTEIFGLLYE